mmetsp:Transcript_119731/g.217548  ORF Transcript_119731/g.217548 Transcript_119731/m.217548 type:complete len:169 (+) Transcript_119731:454-960(+)
MMQAVLPRATNRSVEMVTNTTEAFLLRMADVTSTAPNRFQEGIDIVAAEKSIARGTVSIAVAVLLHTSMHRTAARLAPVAMVLSFTSILARQALQLGHNSIPGQESPRIADLPGPKRDASLSLTSCTSARVRTIVHCHRTGTVAYARSWKCFPDESLLQRAVHISLII